jgi:hypothetical protein
MKLCAACGDSPRVCGARSALRKRRKKTKRAGDFRSISNPRRRLKIGALLAYRFDCV